MGEVHLSAVAVTRSDAPTSLHGGMSYHGTTSAALLLLAALALLLLPFAYGALAQTEIVPAAPAVGASPWTIVGYIAAVIGGVIVIPAIKALVPVFLKRVEAADAASKSSAKAGLEREQKRDEAEVANVEFIRGLVTKFSDATDTARREFLSALDKQRAEFGATLERHERTVQDIASSIRGCPFNAADAQARAAAIAATKEANRG